MHTRFSKDVASLSELKRNPSKVVSRAQDTHRPILLISRGRGVAVVQGLEDFEQAVEELEFVKAIARGLPTHKKATPCRWLKPGKRWVLARWSCV